MDEIEKLYRKHASAVLRFAWGLCGDRGAAEDVVSETFMRILTRVPRIETRTALGYLLAVAGTPISPGVAGKRVRCRSPLRCTPQPPFQRAGLMTRLT